MTDQASGLNDGRMYQYAGMIKDWDAAHRSAPLVLRQELPSLARVPDADARLFLRFYLRSNKSEDQDIARARCQEYGIDYDTARNEARRS